MGVAKRKKKLSVLTSMAVVKGIKSIALLLAFLPETKNTKQIVR